MTMTISVHIASSLRGEAVYYAYNCRALTMGSAERSLLSTL